MISKGLCLSIGISLLLSWPMLSKAAESSESSDLEKQLANPFANLTTLPLQYNFYVNTAKDYEAQTVMNIQPVFSFPMDESWTMINRIIMPMISSSTNNGTDSVAGFGDLIYQGYYVPNTSGPIAYGIGAMLSLPTGSDPRISSGKFGGGPALGFIYTNDKWSLGGVAFQNWSFGGSPNRKSVNLLTIQPLVSYRMGGGWSFSPVNNIVYDQSLSGEQWTVPLGISFNKLNMRKAVPINLVFGVFGRIIHPDQAADVEGKAQMNLVF